MSAYPPLRRLAALALAPLMLLPAPVIAAPSDPGQAAREAIYLGACAGRPVDAAIRARSAEIAALGDRLDPVAWRKGDAAFAAAYAKIRNDPSALNRFRSACRVSIEFGPPTTPALAPAFDAERALVRTLDPTVMAEARTKSLVSEQTLLHLRAIAGLYAQRTGLPGPSARFLEVVRARLAAGAVTPGSDLFHTIAAADDDAAFVDAGLSVIPAAKRAVGIAQDRAAYATLAGDARDWRLATDAATIARGGMIATNLGGSMMLGLLGQGLARTSHQTWGE